MKKKTVFSIITVVYNSKIFIEKTILSVINQTYKNIEYIVIDGASTDGTLEILKKYADKIDIIISEADKGLYDAMNKGLKKASGDYVWFINSGDTIRESDTTEKIVNGFRGNFPQIIYGETFIKGQTGKDIGIRRLKAPDNLTWKDFSRGMLVSHQAFIAQRKICPTYKLEFKYSADYEWTLSLLKKAENIHNTKMILANFMDGGQTKQTIIPGLKERFIIMSRNYGFIKTLYRHIFIGFNFFRFYFKNKWF